MLPLFYVFKMCNLLVTESFPSIIVLAVNVKYSFNRKSIFKLEFIFLNSVIFGAECAHLTLQIY